MNKFGIRMAVAAAACSALSLGACWAEDTKKNAADAAKDVTTAASEAASDVAETAKEAGEATKEVAVAAADKAADATESAVEATKDAAAAAADKASDVAASVKEAASNAIEASKDAAGDAADATKDAAEKTVAAADDAAKAAEEMTPVELEKKKEEDAAAAIAAGNADKKFEDGRYRLPNGNPTYNVKDGVVDWASWQGFRRYHDACHVCHGPNAGGSTFAPALMESLKTMSYEDFVGVVSAGREANRGGTTYVMPSFATNPDVMCYLDDIYTYIKGRADGATPPGRPIGREDISDVAKKQAAECLGE